MVKDKQSMPLQNDDLLAGLEALGCQLEDNDGATLVSLPDDFGEFLLERFGDMIYIGTTFMAPEEFSDSEHAATLDRFLLELQDRNLGCHFSYDREGFLTIGAELYPRQQQADDVFQRMDQIAFIIDASLPLCDQVLETGVIPADREIDEAFGLNSHLH